MQILNAFGRTLLLKLLIVLCPTIFQSTSAENQFAPKVVLYEDLHAKGSSISSQAKNVPDLSQLNFNNKAQSVCLKGVWIFYVEENYRNHNSGVTALFRNDGSCINFDPLRRKISSFRFAGSPKDFRADILDLFDGPLFTNAHLRVNLDIPHLHETGLKEVESAIVSGKSKWTLYEKPDYKGRSLCIAPKGNNVPSFYKNKFDADIDRIGGVHSVRKGCHPNSNVVTTTTTTSTTPMSSIISTSPSSNSGTSPTSEITEVTSNTSPATISPIIPANIAITSPTTPANMPSTTASSPKNSVTTSAISPITIPSRKGISPGNIISTRSTIPNIVPDNIVYLL